MKNFILTRILKWIGGRMDGYKTYAGAAGKALAGLGTLITGIIGIIGIIFPDQGLPKMEMEPALGLISAGIFAISSGLASYGVGKKIEKAWLIAEDRGDFGRGFKTFANLCNAKRTASQEIGF